MKMNTSLHPRMPKTLEATPVKEGVALIMRHSIRYSIPPGSQGVNVPLTPLGIQLAEKWGEQLNRPIGHIASSPIGRCIDTGKAIARGAGINCDIIVEPLLGEPGAFVVDVEEAGPWFYHRDPLEMINRQLQGGYIPGTRPIEEGVSLILQLLLGNLPTPGKLSIYITHDSVLACVIYHLVGIDDTINADMWPWALEGCCLWKTDYELKWVWRGEPSSILLNKEHGTAISRAIFSVMSNKV